MLTKTSTGYNSLNISQNDLILFLLFLKICLVYFHIYLKFFKQLFCTVFKNYVLIQFFK